MCETELAWAAGFFDGEGNIGIVRWHKKYPRLRLQVTQKDPRALHRLAKAVGAGKVNGPYYQRSTHIHRWEVVSETAHQVLESLWPYLGDARREQANQVLERLHEEQLG